MVQQEREPGRQVVTLTELEQQIASAVYEEVPLDSVCPKCSTTCEPIEYPTSKWLSEGDKRCWKALAQRVIKIVDESHMDSSEKGTFRILIPHALWEQVKVLQITPTGGEK